MTAIDASPEVLELARARVDDPRVSYVLADLFAWEPDRTYDVCFFGFWLSHVPEERFEIFGRKSSAPLDRRAGCSSSTACAARRRQPVDHKLPDQAEETMLRRLADGREYRIVKRFHEPEPLQQRLVDLGWNAQVQTTREFFIYGQATPGV